MIVYETERLLLREFSEKDIDGFFELNNDPVVLEYTGDRAFKHKDEVRRFIENYDQYNKYGLGRWSLYLKDNDEYIGFSGLRKSDETGEVDIGFRIMRKHWGKGYATESALASLKLAYERFGVEKVIARAMKNNSASHAVIKKLGMELVGTFTEDGCCWIKYSMQLK